MIAFFFTMPISRMMPINAMTLRSVRDRSAAPEGADARRRQRRKNRERMDVALVQNAQHDINRDDRREDQAAARLREGSLKGARRALELPFAH